MQRNVVSKNEILQVEQVIISMTRNEFTTLNTDIKSIKDDKIIVGEQFFKVDDSIIIKGAKGIPDGLYNVDYVEDNTLTINYSSRIQEPDETTAKVYLVEYPMDIKNGVMDIFQAIQSNVSQEISGYNPRIKAQSIGRMSTTYNTDASNGGLLAGVDAKLFSFLEPYRKLGWD